MEGYGEAMSFVADHLYEMQDRRMMIENHGLVFLSVDINNLFSLGDRSQRLVDDFERFECLRGCVKLSDAAVDQHQTGHRLFLFAYALVASRHHFSHAGKVVHPGNALDDELAVIGFLHLAVFPHHHRSHRLSSLNVRDVETFNPLRELRKTKRVLESLLNSASVRLHNAEPLVVRLLGVGARQIDELTLVAALRHRDVNPRCSTSFACQLLAQCIFQFSAIFEVYRDVDIARYVRLPQIKLLEESRKEFDGTK